MPSIIHLSTIWEHTLDEILTHNNKTQVGIIIRSWVKHNKLEDMADLLIYDLNDLTLSGTLCYYKETAESKETTIMPNTPLKELHNLYTYIQHLILESEYDDDDDDSDNPLDEDSWLLQTTGKCMKFVIYHCLTATESRKIQSKSCQFQKRHKKGRDCLPYIER